MYYENLHTLIQRSSSTRQYFLSLPVAMQVALHEYNDYIHTAQELRQSVEVVTKACFKHSRKQQF